MTPEEKPWGKASRSLEEERFLQGPANKIGELKRALRILGECIRGFRAFHRVGPCVTIFGSTRFTDGHPYYRMASEVAALLGRNRFAIMTGGGPGIMEAANRGAQSVGALSLGCNIQLPQEQEPNKFLDRWLEFRYFFVRKFMLVKYSSAFIIMPGGFGTLDELFEILTLVQSEKIRNFPVILMGRDYWQPLLDFVRETLLKQGSIDRDDADIMIVTDHAEEACQLIRCVCR